MRYAVRRPLLWHAATVAVLVLLAGCGSTESAQDPTTPEEPVPSSTTPTPPTEAPVVTTAKASLAGLLDIEASEITLVTLEEVTWRDGSLGCARKGMSYTQALVDGQRIVLEVDGTAYEFHTGASGSPFYCESPTQ